MLQSNLTSIDYYLTSKETGFCNLITTYSFVTNTILIYENNNYSSKVAVEY